MTLLVLELRSKTCQHMNSLISMKNFWKKYSWIVGFIEDSIFAFAYSSRTILSKCKLFLCVLHLPSFSLLPCSCLQVFYLLNIWESGTNIRRNFRWLYPNSWRDQDEISNYLSSIRSMLSCAFLSENLVTSINLWYSMWPRIVLQ